MNSRLQPPSAILIVRDLVRGPQPEEPRPWLVIALALAACLLPLAVVVIGGAP